MANDVLTVWQRALAYAAGAPAETAFSGLSGLPETPAAVLPAAADLELVLAQAISAEGEYTGAMSDSDARRLVNLCYAMAATLQGAPALALPDDCGPRMRRLYRKEPVADLLFTVIPQLQQLQAGCDAFPDGSFQLVKACGGLLHYQRAGQWETADVLCNRTPHLLVEEIGGKAAEVNPYGFTIAVQDRGHNPDHGYYRYR